MDKEQHEKLRSVQEVVSIALKDPTLAPENKRELEDLQSQLAGQAFRPWLPIGWPRKMLMLIAVLVGLYGLVTGPKYLGFALLVAATFSPHIVGFTIYYSARFVGMLLGRSR